jgi:4'-phosphopantetheinyl transferase EntD
MAGGPAVSATRAASLVTEVAARDLYPVAFSIDSGFGRCVGVDLAAALVTDPSVLIALLHPEERLLCRGMRGPRLVEFAGGRIASRLARAGMRDADRPTLRGPAGEPTAASISVSISHTRRFAVALANADAGCTIGVDIEALDEDQAIPLLAERILSEDERVADRAGEPIPILRRLSLKEAAYKALFPRFGHVRLREISVLPSGAGAGYRITTLAGYGTIAATSSDLDRHVLSCACLS